MKPVGVTRVLRRTALREQSYLDDFCWYCGVATQRENQSCGDFATLDHVIPRAGGGRGSWNYVTACRSCNNRKAAHTLEIFRRMLGGGLFWGELFHTQKVPGTGMRPDSGRTFQRWLDMQLTIGKDDWMKQANAAKNLRSMATGIAFPRHKEWRIKFNPMPWSFVIGIRWERAGRLAIYLPGIVIVIGKFFESQKPSRERTKV